MAAQTGDGDDTAVILQRRPLVGRAALPWVQCSNHVCRMREDHVDQVSAVNICVSCVLPTFVPAACCLPP